MVFGVVSAATSKWRKRMAGRYLQFTRRESVGDRVPLQMVDEREDVPDLRTSRSRLLHRANSEIEDWFNRVEEQRENVYHEHKVLN